MRVSVRERKREGLKGINKDGKGHDDQWEDVA